MSKIFTKFTKYHHVILSVALMLTFTFWSFTDFSANANYMQEQKKTEKFYTHKRVKRWLNGKPAIVNILVVNPQQRNITIKPSFGSHLLDEVNSVKDIVNIENAIAGVNASFFKPVNGKPLGISIIDGEIKTGPLYKRVVLGITNDNKFKMDKLVIHGDIYIGKNIKLNIFNINQPVFSNKNFTIFTDQWGAVTPKTSQYYSHIVVSNDRVQYVKNSSVHIPKDGYVIVGPHKILPKYIQKNDPVCYEVKLTPDDWNTIKYAVGGGPYLVKDGKMFIDKQHFSKTFLWTKEPRTAVGYTKSGTLILVTIDGRQKDFSEGATLSELAKIMWELGAYNAMNLDGGTSTQMVVDGKLVNYPSIKGGGKVTNALVIVPF